MEFYGSLNRCFLEFYSFRFRGSSINTFPLVLLFSLFIYCACSKGWFHIQYFIGGFRFLRCLQKLFFCCVFFHFILYGCFINFGGLSFQIKRSFFAFFFFFRFLLFISFCNVLFFFYNSFLGIYNF